MSKNHWWKPKFKTKKLLEERVRGISAGTPIGSYLSGDNTQFMIWVLSHNDEFEDKCGLGLGGLVVGLDQHGNRYFLIERVDGSKIDISWVHALTPNSSKRKWFLAALRQEVGDQILDFRKSSGKTCGICGSEISGVSHVDHVKPFRDLVIAFFGGDTHDTIDMGEYSLLCDRDLAQSWKDYHMKNAELQITHQHCNLKKG